MAVTITSILKYQSSAGGSKLNVSDNFNSRSDGSLAGQGVWTTGSGSITVASSLINPTGAGQNSIVYWNDTTNNNQWSQLTVNDAGSSRFMGPAVRCSNTGGGQCYALTFGNGDIGLWRIVGNTETVLDYYTPGAGPYTLKISVSGSDITCWVNGSLATSIGTNGTFTDATITSGFVGVQGYENGTLRTGDDWSGGDV
jgi:hypothetical protein